MGILRGALGVLPAFFMYNGGDFEETADSDIKKWIDIFSGVYSIRYRGLQIIEHG